MLEEFYQLDLNLLLQKKTRGIIEVIGKIEKPLLLKLLECAITSEDISNAQRKVLIEVHDQLSKETM